jgi:hypothetical protein
MTSVRSTFEEEPHRDVDQEFAQQRDSSAKIDFPDHPTLAEITRRQKELATWEALNVGGYRFAKPGAIGGFLLCAVMVILVVTPIPPNWPWNIPLVILAVFTAVGTAVCALLWFDSPDIGPRPEPLAIVPFSRSENLHLMNGQAVEPYQANCTCPGCGDASTHSIREPTAGAPEWATVTRQCGVCAREWAQD